MKNYYLIPFLIFLFTNCNGDKTTSGKAVTELEYSEIVDSVINKSAGEGIEYHGEPINEEAKADVSLKQTEACDCGKNIQLSNNGEKDIKVMIYAPFKVATMESHTSRFYNLKAGESVIVGCSDFCYDGKAYPFQYRIAGAEYL